MLVFLEYMHACYLTHDYGYDNTLILSGLLTNPSLLQGEIKKGSQSGIMY